MERMKLICFLVELVGPLAHPLAPSIEEFHSSNYGVAGYGLEASQANKQLNPLVFSSLLIPSLFSSSLPSLLSHFINKLNSLFFIELIKG